MFRRETSKKAIYERLFLGAIITLLVSGFFVIPQAHAAVPTVNTAVKVATNQSADTISTAATYGAVPFAHATCFTNGLWFVVYRITGGGHTLWYSWSSDGLSWASPQLLYTTTNTFTSWTISCFTTFIEIAYSSTTSPYQFLTAVNISTPTSPVAGSEAGVTGAPASTSGNFVGMDIDSATGSLVTTQQQNGVANLYTFTGGAYVRTIAVGSGLTADEPLQSTSVFALFNIQGGQGPAIWFGGTLYNVGGLGARFDMGQPAYANPSGGVQKIIFPFSTGGADAGKQCQLTYFDTFARTYSTITPGGAAASCNDNPANNWATSDNNQNLWVIYGNAAQMYTSTDGGTTLTLTPLTLKAGATQLFPYAMTGIVGNQGQQQAMLVLTDQAGNIYTILIGSAATAGTQNQTIGSCPTKNTATFTMVNSTIYLYYGNALGNEVVNNIQTAIASVGGSTGTHTIQLLIYGSTSNVANPTTPLNLIYSTKIALTSGTGHAIITSQTNLNLPSNGFLGTGALWAVGVVGDNKINLNQSALSGLFTLPGNPSTATQPSSFTTQGTGVGTEIYLCANASYQNVITSTSTSTTTIIGTTSTITTTINQAGIVTQGNAYIALIVIITLFLVMAKFGGLPGAMLGAIVGIIVVILGGFLTGAPAYIAIILIGVGSLAVIVSRITNAGSSGSGM